jgi:hypothetical protein
MAGAITRRLGVSKAEIGTVLGSAIPALASDVVNAQRDVRPYDAVARTVALGLLLNLKSGGSAAMPLAGDAAASNAAIRA